MAERSGPSPADSSPVDHSGCDHAFKPVRCDRCGREFVCTPWDDFYCAAEGDHCCEQCLLAAYPAPVIVLDPYTDTSRLRRPGGGPDAPRSPGGDPR